MSYTKIAIPATLDVLSSVAQVLSQNKIDPSLSQDLADAGTLVQLETGDQVWVSCILHDRPETPQVDFLTVGFSVKNGSIWMKPNGQSVSVAFWHGVFPELIAAQGVSLPRQALMKIVLGEQQPQVSVPVDNADPIQVDLIQIDTASRCIRTYVNAAVELVAPLEDVL